MRFQTAMLVTVVVLSAACRGEVAPARAPLDWSAIADDQMILVVTGDPEVQPRTTRLWIVVLDGHGHLRSSETAWSHDVERDSSFRLLAADVSYPVRASRVPHGTEEHARVMEAFAEKYGLLGRTVLRCYSLIGRYSGPADARIFRLSAGSPAQRPVLRRRPS